MLETHESFDERASPECRAVVASIQRLLDGDASTDTRDAKPHLGECSSCRERVQAVRVLLSVLANPEPVTVPAGFADRVVKAMWEDRHTRTRRGVYKATAWFALAAAVLVGVVAIFGGSKPVPADEIAKQPEVAPESRAKTLQPAPEPRPINIGDAFAKAEQALRDAPKPLTDSVAAAPKLLDALTAAFTKPAAPMPMGDMLEPARKSIAELPDAARTSLEPVTGTAQKAFDRLLRDVASVKPKS